MKELKLYRRDAWYQITIRTDLVALVDDDRYEELNKYKWYAKRDNNTYYIRALIPIIDKKNPVCLHHYLMGVPLNGYVIDHKNGKGEHCYLENMRVVTKRQNCQSRHHNKEVKSPGVTMIRDKFNARIQISGKIKQLGHYTTEKEAFAVYQKACEELGQEVLNYGS